MKIKLIEDRCDRCDSGYTVGKIYTAVRDGEYHLKLIDDQGDERVIGTSLTGEFWDWEIVE